MGKGNLQAKRYAQAIFKIALESEGFELWESDLEKIAGLAQDNTLVSFIEDPKFSVEQKIKLVSPQFQLLNPLPSNFLKLVISQNKFGLLQDIIMEYQDLLNKNRGIEKAEVTTAVPLEENDRLKIQNDIESLTGKKVRLSLKVNPEIVGGIIIEIGGKLIDGSTSNRLNILKNEMIGIKN